MCYAIIRGIVLSWASFVSFGLVERFHVLFVVKNITIETTGTGNIEHEYCENIYYEYSSILFV
jgi:hypothetical protein